MSKPIITKTEFAQPIIAAPAMAKPLPNTKKHLPTSNSKHLVDLKHHFRQWTVWLSIMIGILIGLDAATFTFNWPVDQNLRLLFNLTVEQSLANWLSCVITLAVALVAFFNYKVQAQPIWFFVAWFFFFAATDDATALHERLGDFLKSQVDNSDFDYIVIAFPSYSWQLFIAPLFVLAGLMIIRQLKTILNQHEMILLLVGFMFLGTALAFDFVEGLFLKLFTASIAGHLLLSAEEVLEMSGMLVVFLCFGKHLSRTMPLSITTDRKL
ncbi:MAG: hypothetical protein KUG79_10820 [Pseudomonadales bacterium]|nr:hypothetical protein [Pseudomonadales bacterium]